MVLISILVLLFALPHAMAAVPGDANGDGGVDHEDLVTVIHEIVDGTPSPSRANADMDGNGLVDLRDLAAIVDLILLGPGTTLKTEVVTVEIPFNSIEKDNPNAMLGDNKVSQAGQVGTKEITYIITLVDGIETERKVHSENIIKAPVDEIILVGSFTVTPEYEYYPLSGGGVGGPHDPYYEGRAKAHAMAMAKEGRVYHSGSGGYLESVAGRGDPSGLASVLVNHVGAFKAPDVSYGFGCVRVRVVSSEGGVSEWYYYACLQGTSIVLESTPNP